MGCRTLFLIVQNLDPCKCECEDCGLFYRTVMVFVVGGITCGALLVVISHYIWHKRKYSKVDGYERIGEDESLTGDYDPL